MTLRDFPLLADQNIHPAVVGWLRGEGFDVLTAADAGLAGAADTAVLARAVADGRVVLTHDADFGTLAVAGGSPLVGIVYLRPGHVGPEPTADTLRHLLAAGVELTPPVVVVARRVGDRVTIRVRPITAAPPGGEPDRG